MALEWLKADHACRMLITSDFEVLWANEATAAELPLGCGLEVRDGRLVFSDQARCSEFSAAIAAAPSGSCCLSFPGGEKHILVRFDRVGGDGSDAAFGLTVRRCGSYKPTAVDLVKAFGLTASEYRVFLRLFDGLTAEDAATSLGVGIETVRSHIRQIYGKLGVRSREGLFQRVMPYCF